MQYSLFPFASLKGAGGPDICEQLRIRRAERKSSGGSLGNLEILEELVTRLRELPWEIRVDHCEESGGELWLAVVAHDLGRDIAKGDRVNAGLCLRNSESGQGQTVACERVFRVACENGALVECEHGQSVVIRSQGRPAPQWKQKLSAVVARCFDADGLDVDLARFRATLREMLMAPYELLCSLVAQRIISEEEQVEIQHEFDEVGDYTMYGLINAVTSVARHLRDFESWKRSFELERLGGAILRGDHQPPVMDPVYR